MADHWRNIKGCLIERRDFESARVWLSRAKRELGPSRFDIVLGELDRWASTWAEDEEMVEAALGLLAEYDPNGDVQRRAKVAEEKLRLEKEGKLRVASEEQRKKEAIEEERRREERRKLKEEKLRHEEELEVRRNGLVARIHRLFEEDYLNAQSLFEQDNDKKLLEGGSFEELRSQFVRKWAGRELGISLDDEQAAAVGAVEGNIQVTARAGSGKTRTLVTRALFLLKHCNVAPTELLLLAFNKSAAEEMKDRIQNSIGGRSPHVMTFHSLAYSLEQPEESLVFDNEEEEQREQSRLVQEVIDEHVRSGEHHDLIRELMLIQFREDWERIVDGRFELSIDEFLKHRRSLPRESLNREYVKSFGEKLIANTLFEHGVEYKYERNHRWSGINYRPDFTIFGGTKRGVIIEYFGLQGDADYDEMSEKKRAYWNEKPEWEFLEFTPKDIVQHGEEAFVRSLIQKLTEHGCTCERRSEEEIWELVKERAIDDFTKAVMGFISRCRQKNLSSESLGKLIEAHTPCTKAEKLFLQAGQWIYHGYCQHLIANEKEDFDGLMWRAVGRVRNGETLFVRDKGRECGDVGKLRFVMVDEFQDFSEVFYKLISAIQSRNSQVQFFCVGDDWQAINGFAGSNLSYFEDFNDYFENATKHTISTNYRSPSGVVEIGNALMSGRGSLAKSERAELGWVRFCNLSDFSPTPVEEERHSGDEITPAVLRQLRFLLDKGLDVVLLTRRNGVPWYINYESSLKRVNRQLDRFLAHIRSYLPEDDRGRVTISTVHKYKGLEKEAVIVLDASSRSYPLIHVNWIFLRIFGDRIGQIEDDERRLLYVALTRAQDSLAIMASSQDRSPFLDDVRSRMELREIQWQELKPVPSLDSPQLIIKVFDAYKVKDMLKNLHYRYERDEKCWQKGVMEEGFSYDALMSQSWAKQGYRVEVYTETGGLKYKNY